MGRFAVCDYDEAKRYDDPEEWLVESPEFEYQGSYLVDTEEGIIVFCDYMFTLDDSIAFLDDGLRPLVRYMEKLAA